MKVAIYAKGADDEQIAELRAWVVAQGFTDIIEYRDVTPLRGRSGDKGLTRLLQDAKNRKFGILYVNKLEQLVQSYPPNVLLLICVLKGYGVRLISRAEI
jgi:DNA invertase Pin-like site-specific DNA recombinase